MRKDGHRHAQNFYNLPYSLTEKDRLTVKKPVYILFASDPAGVFPTVFLSTYIFKKLFLI